MRSQRALRLFHFATSNSSWRVRWALALKGLACEMVTVDLAAGEQKSPTHLARNPLGLVPVLELVGDPQPFMTESVAIIEWLDEAYPESPLLPRSGRRKATARQLAQIINADTHPLQNTGTGAFYSKDPTQRLVWNQHWIEQGLRAYESTVVATAGRFSMGDEISYADLFLVPMTRNALRDKVDLAPFPTVRRIYEAARATEACLASEPERYGAAPLPGVAAT